MLDISMSVFLGVFLLRFFCGRHFFLHVVLPKFLGALVC